VLAAQAELAFARIRKYATRYRGGPGEILEVLFSELGRWAARPGFAGAGFTRIVMELADLPGHPAHAVARRHKAAVEAWYAELFRSARTAAPERLAREVALLVEGATTMILISRDRAYADAGPRAAKTLLASA
jgi:hypothetical protein